MTARIHQEAIWLCSFLCCGIFYFYYWFNLFTNYWSVMEILLKNPGCCWRAVGPSDCSLRAGQTCARAFHDPPPLLEAGRALLLPPVSPQTSGSQASSGGSSPVSDTQMEKSQVSWCCAVRHFCPVMHMIDLQVKGREKEALVPSWCWRLYYRVILKALILETPAQTKWKKSQNG